jgi:RNA polymerase sigma-70 factor (ECF subfamily)
MMNGLPALVTEFAQEATGEARWFVTRLDLDGDGRITALHSVLASRKLTAVRGAPASG